MRKKRGWCAINPLARELNEIIRSENETVFSLLSGLGKELFFPRGIIDQTAEAKQKATRFNATIGIARQDGQAMYLPSMTRYLNEIGPDESLAYAPTQGLPRLRERWKLHQSEENPSLRGKHTSLPVVTSGITHGLNLVAELFCDPGDHLLLPDMLWGNYRMVFALRRGAELVHFPFFDRTGGMDLKALRGALTGLPTGSKAVILLNFPNNPTGYTPTEAEAAEILDIVGDAAESGRDVLVICDDAYFGFFYEQDSIQESLFGRLCDLHPRVLAVKLDGATKEEYAWGLRIGFLTLGTKGLDTGSGLYEAMNRKVGGAIRSSVSCCSTLAQSLVLKTIDSPSFPREKQEKYEVMRGRYARVKEVLSGDGYSDAWTPYPFNSGYFMCLRLARGEANEVRLRLLDEDGVGVISLADRDIRIAFSCIEEYQVQELFDLLYNSVMNAP